MYEVNKLIECHYVKIKELEPLTAFYFWSTKFLRKRIRGSFGDGSTPRKSPFFGLVFLRSGLAGPSKLSLLLCLHKTWLISCVWPLTGCHFNSRTWQLHNPVINRYHIKFSTTILDWFQKTQLSHSSPLKELQNNFILLFLSCRYSLHSFWSA